MDSGDRKESLPWRGRRALMRGRGRAWARRDHDRGTFSNFSAENESEETRRKRQERFGDQIDNRSRSAKAWSSSIWKENEEGKEGVKETENAGTKRTAIGLGRATGFSRVPDAALSSSLEGMKGLCSSLQRRTKALERDGYVLIYCHVHKKQGSRAEGEILAAWDPVLAEFRELTMAVTAAGYEQVGPFCVQLYESAADASLLAGNLSYYLSCQTRLLSDLYRLYPNSADRRYEFTGYSLLYFGVFCPGHLELARMMRVMTIEGSSIDEIRTSFNILTSFRARNGPKFLSLFSQSNIRQQTILHSEVEEMKKLALRQLTRAYMTLNKDFAIAELQLDSREEFLNLLEVERPELIPENNQESKEYQFRVKGRKR